jgi:hypothetical protein
MDFSPGRNAVDNTHRSHAPSHGWGPPTSPRETVAERALRVCADSVSEVHQSPPLEDERLREDGALGETLEPVRREIEARLFPEQLRRGRFPHRRALHEAVA